jgi:hypothetical protein
MIPEKYPVREVETGNYDERTLRNILDADATLIITHRGYEEEGTSLTFSWCSEYARPCFKFDVADLSRINRQQLTELSNWIDNNKIEVLNVAGNRESNSPGIQIYTLTLLERLFFPSVTDE